MDGRVVERLVEGGGGDASGMPIGAYVYQSLLLVMRLLFVHVMFVLQWYLPVVDRVDFPPSFLGLIP
jgi:hypothetical protein